MSSKSPRLRREKPSVPTDQPISAPLRKRYELADVAKLVSTMRGASQHLSDAMLRRINDPASDLTEAQAGALFRDEWSRLVSHVESTGRAYWDISQRTPRGAEVLASLNAKKSRRGRPRAGVPRLPAPVLPKWRAVFDDATNSDRQEYVRRLSDCLEFLLTVAEGVSEAPSWRVLPYVFEAGRLLGAAEEFLANGTDRIGRRELERRSANLTTNLKRKNEDGDDAVALARAARKVPRSRDEVVRTWNEAAKKLGPEATDAKIAKEVAAVLNALRTKEFKVRQGAHAAAWNAKMLTYSKFGLGQPAPEEPERPERPRELTHRMILSDARQYKLLRKPRGKK